MWALRSGRGSCCNEGSLHLVPLMVFLMGSLKGTAFVVFLKPLQGGVQCDWSRLMRGSWKVTLLTVFLKPFGVGEVGTLRVSMCK